MKKRYEEKEGAKERFDSHEKRTAFEKSASQPNPCDS
jgi:hypothetical protein